jgi:hypothetical protein
MEMQCQRVVHKIADQARRQLEPLVDSTFGVLNYLGRERTPKELLNEAALALNKQIVLQDVLEPAFVLALRVQELWLLEQGS